MWKTKHMVDSMAQPTCHQSGAVEQNCWLSLIYSTIQSNVGDQRGTDDKQIKISNITTTIEVEWVGITCYKIKVLQCELK